MQRVEVHKGFTQEELKEAFEAVQDKEDWRDCIEGFVSEENLKVTIAAIGFYVGEYPQVFCHQHLTETPYEIISRGYRNGPCGP